MNESILIVDDEKEIADLIEVYLVNDGYKVYKFHNGIEALKCAESIKLDLAILDVMLPDVDGFSICQKIREKYFYPIIMLTAKVEDTDKIMGLTIGADDYITKPFNPLEVVARVKTQLRRYVRYNGNNETANAPINEYDINGLIINKDTHKCSLFGDYQGIDGIYVNGELTLSENIADLGALNCVAQIVGNDPEKLKIMFERYAQIWAVKMVPEYEKLALNMDTHAPGKVRMNAVMSSTDAYYIAYPELKLGDKMYLSPEKRVKIW